jgi:hypothetical protein
MANMLQNDLLIRLPPFHFDADLDPALHFDADSTLMRKRILIQLPKMMQIYADPDPQHCSFIRKNNSTILSSKKLLVRGKYFLGSSFIPSLCLLVG